MANLSFHLLRNDGAFGRISVSIPDTKVHCVQRAAEEDPHARCRGMSVCETLVPHAMSLRIIPILIIHDICIVIPLQVSWMASGTKLSDINPTSGVVTFAENQRTAQFSIDILPDAIPELQQNFSVWLTTPSGGSVLGASLYSNFSVL